MRLKRNFILFYIFIHLVLIGFTIIIFKKNITLFLILELLIIISSVVTIYFYRALFRPFKLLQSGIESISDQDFGIKFRNVGQPDMDRLIFVYNKMIDQLRLERTKLNEKHFLLEKLIEASPASIIMLDVNEKIQSLNQQAKLLFHQKLTPNCSIDELPEPWATQMTSLRENTSIIVILNGIKHFKCFKSYFFDRGVKRYFFIIEELTNEIVKTEKQAFEKVIRMMSHEVNNSVGAVNSIIDSTVLYMNKNDHERTKDFVHALEAARERNLNLTRFTSKLADVIRIPEPNVQSFTIVEWLLKMKTLVYSFLEEKKIDLHIKHANEFLITADPHQLEQVIVNVIKNAAEACGRNGIINIRTSRKPDALIIENNGSAIPENVKPNLFKPFYTTKRNGQGIGLTISREILLNHKFKFSLETRNDGITEFKIIFS